MKALVIHGPLDLRYEHVSDPQIKDSRDIIVKMKRCGICGSDLHFFHGEIDLPRKVYGIGHEAVGEVVEKGSSVTGLAIGDTVMIAGSTGCGDCRPCLMGHIKRCERSQLQVFGVGWDLEGCQAEGIRVPAGDFNAARVPEGISEDQALLLTDNLPTAYGACIDAKISAGKSVAVIGLGTIGLMATELSFVMGATQVFAIDLVESRRQQARALGAIAMDPAEAVAIIKEQTRGAMVDCVIEAVGGDATTSLSFELVRVMGNIAILGVNATMDFKIPYQLFVNGVTISGNALTEVSKHWGDLIPMLQHGRIAPQRWITHRESLADGVEAYQRFDRRDEGTLKTVMVPEG